MMLRSFRHIDDEQTPLDLIMNHSNPLEYKHRIAGQPYRLARRLVGPLSRLDDEELDDNAQFWGFATLALGAAYTVGLNIAAPFSLITSGYRGNRYFSHLSIGYSSLGYPMPRFNYVTPFSAAERTGARIGGRVGARAGTRAGVLAGAKLGAKVGGRLIPGVGWALLAYDVYDIAANRSLWGFDLS